MFQLAKTWVDYVPTNHTVEIRYTWSELDQRPRWSGDEEAEVMSVLPNTNPPTRLAVLEIPRYLDKKPNTEVRALWSVDGWSAPNWSQAKLKGLKLNVRENEAGHDAEGEGIADEAIYELVQTVPLPRRFVARVWGPKGATVEYVFQLLRTNSPVPEDDFARWDNNQSQNYRMVL